MKVEITRRAEDDRHRIWMFQSDRSMVQAYGVYERLEQRIASLGSFPKQGRPLRDGTRELSVPDIQLVFRYRMDEDAVRILRVWHTRENREEP